MTAVAEPKAKHAVEEYVNDRLAKTYTLTYRFDGNWHVVIVAKRHLYAKEDNTPAVYRFEELDDARTAFRQIRNTLRTTGYRLQATW